MTTKIISEAELEVIFTNLSKLAELANTNAYDYYIQTLKTQRLSEQPDKESYYERHHIIPRFEKGKSTDAPENIVKVTVKEHVIAHWLRYKVFNKPQDQCAYLFRVGDTINAIKIRNELVSQARERDRIEKRYFFDADFQAKMGKRGGKKGGSAGSDAQFLARQKVGLQYGRKTGIKNQKETLKEFIANWSIWAFSENAFSTSRVKDRGKELHVLISTKKVL
uniref:HNH homing endonuclease n=1 Tax=Dunaliella salina TaxID=3046 RepID=D0FY12_DUNSA|nr:HNH homing endonuclease [Dunaliella salina]ACS95095.1 HNH homing endonuclease [Dunaliella salina]